MSLKRFINEILNQNDYQTIFLITYIYYIRVLIFKKSLFIGLSLRFFFVY
jgi:hypothetical protein